ncbi:MAG: hypothetical protein HDQ97_16405 [Lachnospiraceae bacterium]|nr:hypothetical protein [Lachnospiraceae bacterium]
MIDINKKQKTDRVILTAVFLGYLIFNGILLARHELWRDEANVWLMAKYLSPLQLFAEIKYQGHPCLWYLLIMPFAKAGLPFRTISFISYLIMAVSAGLFLFKAPLSKIIKAAAVFSPIFTYYYAEIARNYCLIALLLVLLALCYPKRNEKCVLYGLLLGLLVQSDVVILMAAGMISLMWLCENLWKCFRERTKAPFFNILKGIWIPLFSLFLLVLQFYHVSDSPVFQVNSYGVMDLLKEIRNYSCWILIRLTGRGETFCKLFLCLFAVLLLVVSVRLKNVWAAVVMAAAYLFEALFSAVIYQLHIWHFIALCFVMLWTVWVLQLQVKEKRPAGKAAGIALWGMQGLMLILSVCMFMRWNDREEASSLENALYGVYSDGVYAAEYIKENIAPDALIISVNVPYASTVLAYLPEYSFYFAGNGQKESYADWSDDQERKISFEELLEWIRISFPGESSFYLLDSGESCLTETDGLSECEVLYQTVGETARREEYTIYQVILRKD